MPSEACPPVGGVVHRREHRQKALRKPLQRRHESNYSPHVVLGLFNSLVAWRQQIGAGTRFPGSRLIVFARTRRYSSLWQSICWPTHTPPRRGPRPLRIFLRTFPVTRVTRSPRGRANSFSSFAMKPRSSSRSRRLQCRNPDREVLSRPTGAEQ